MPNGIKKAKQINIEQLRITTYKNFLKRRSRQKWKQLKRNNPNLIPDCPIKTSSCLEERSHKDSNTAFTAFRGSKIFSRTFYLRILSSSSQTVSSTQESWVDSFVRTPKTWALLTLSWTDCLGLNCLLLNCPVQNCPRTFSTKFCCSRWTTGQKSMYATTTCSRWTQRCRGWTARWSGWLRSGGTTSTPSTTKIWQGDNSVGRKLKIHQQEQSTVFSRCF